MTPRTLGNGYRGNNGNFHNMIYLSLAIHLVVITIILISIPTTSRHLTFGTAYSVQLVGSEAVLPANDFYGLKDILRTNEAPSSIILKRKITSISSTPARTQETNKLDIEKALSAVRRNQRDKPQTTTAASGRQTISETEINSQTNEYIGFVWSKVKQNWTMPQSLLPEKNITAIIDVRIARSGALEYAAFEKRSGNRYFDDSALRAVKKSSPFPPLPYWVMDKSIEIGIRFHSAELR
ncbi:MAG: energy transducer TonB [Deltaproteobacteria bacterium]|nr:energy transducer TonB [Deltaproteobacteria bacterium]